MCLLNDLSFVARYVRVHVNQFHNWPALHLEVVRCSIPVLCQMNSRNSNTTNYIGVPGQRVVVRCNENWQTARDNRTSFVSTCQDTGAWDVQYDCSGLYVEISFPHSLGIHVGTMQIFGGCGEHVKLRQVGRYLLYLSSMAALCFNVAPTFTFAPLSLDILYIHTCRCNGLW